MNDAFRITELERRLANMIRICTVTDVDAENAKAKVSDGDFKPGWRPWAASMAGDDITWRAPSVGEQVVLVSPNGDPDQSFIADRLYQTAHPAPASSAEIVRTVFADGLVVDHNKAEKLTRISALDSEGTIEIEAKNLVLRIGENGVMLTDIFGLASLTRHTGGPDYETESYSIGSTVTGLPAQPLNQPELPTEEVIEE